MPRFLLITILILVLAGHIFGVKDENLNTQPVPDPEQINRIEDLYFNENYAEIQQPLQIIESPSINGEENDSFQTIFIDNGEECIFFENEDIPKLDVCPDGSQDTISTSEF